MMVSKEEENRQVMAELVPAALKTYASAMFGGKVSGAAQKCAADVLRAAGLLEPKEAEMPKNVDVHVSFNPIGQAEDIEAEFSRSGEENNA